MKQGDMASAVRALTAAIANTQDNEDAAISASTQLALSRDLSSSFAAALLRHDSANILLFSSSLCLLTYLTSPDPLPTALSTLSSHLTALQSSTLHHLCPAHITSLLSRLHALKAPLITLHLDQHRPYHPATLLASLASSLTLFPSLSALLALSARLASPLDRLDPHHNPRPWLLLDHASPLPNWLFAIDMALYRFAQGGATHHAVRSLFQRALLRSPVSRVAHAPCLWHAWLDFEEGRLGALEAVAAAAVAAGEKRPGREKQWEVESQGTLVRHVLFEGLVRMPLDKEWVLRALETLDTDGVVGVARDELEGVYHLLFERGLRVRVEIGEGK